jgi:hypothetical protein
MEPKKADYEKRIKTLEQKLTGDMFEDMEIRQEIHQLKMAMNGVKPERKEANTLYCNC